MNSRLAAAIVAEAERIGADPLDFATAMSFETGGSFDVWQKGPTTKWGVHRGLIQMGEPQRQKYGYYQGMPVEDAVRSAADYLVDNGFRPGMSGAQLYATINTGSPYGGHKSDTAAGGTWGSADDKWNHQMGAHREKAAALLGGTYTPVPRSYFPDDRPDSERAQIPYDAYLDVRAPDVASITDQIAAKEAGPQPFESFGREVWEHLSSTSITAQALRWGAEGPADLDYRIGEDRAVALLKEFPDKYHDFLLGSSSESNLQDRIKWAQEDVTRHARLREGGWSAVGAGLVSGIVDPIPLVAGVATGGASSALIGAGRSAAARVAIGAASGAAFNAGIDYGSRRVFDDPHADPVMAAAVGSVFGALGGVLARNPATQAEADVALTAAARAARGTPVPARGEAPTGQGPAVTGPQDSMGAARNPEARDNLISSEDAYVSELFDGDVPVGIGSQKSRFSVVGQMTTSKNPLVRLFGMHLYEESAGLRGHAVVPDSVNSRYNALHRQMIGNFQAAYQPLKRAFLKSEGVGRLSVRERAIKEKEFNAAVTAHVRDPNPSPDVDPNVAAAAEVFRKQMAAFEQRSIDSGLMTEGLGRHYTPLIPEHNRVAEIDRLVHQGTMSKFFTEAILRRTPDMDPKLAARMGEGYWNNLRRAGYGMEDGMTRSLQIGDRDAFKRAFQDALEDRKVLTEEQLDEAFDTLSGMLDDLKSRAQETGKGGAGRHSKSRTLMDYNFKAEVQLRDGSVANLSVYDLFQADAEFLMRRYAKSMSGRIAFAETKIRNPSKGDELIFDGIRSEADLERMKDMVRESFRLSDGDHATNAKELKNALDNIDFAWKRINSIPYWDNAKGYNQWARRLKSMQFTRLMSNMGLNQVQEAWKLATLVGLRSALTQMPAIRRAAAEVAAGRWDKDKLLTELTDMTGMGLDSLHNKFDLRLTDDRIGSGPQTGFAARTDEVLDTLQNLTAQVSLMRSIMDFQQRWAMKAITQQMANMARKADAGGGVYDLSRLKVRDQQRLATMGIGKEDAQLLFRNLMAHSEFDGKKIVGSNPDKWDPEAVSKYRTFLGRYTDRLVQQNDHGALSKWMSQPVAGMFVQFRSFVLGAWDKSTLWAFHHGAFSDPRMMTMLLGELAAGVATYVVRNSHLLATEDGREKFDEMLRDPAKLMANGWARTASASILPALLDTGLSFTAAGPQFGQARASGSAHEALLGTPVVDQVDSIKQFVRGAQRSFLDDREMSQNEIKAGVRGLVPMGNFLPFTAALGALIQDRPEKATK